MSTGVAWAKRHSHRPGRFSHGQNHLVQCSFGKNRRRHRSAPQCGDAMRLARKLPPVRPLAGLVVHPCGRCGYVGAAEREPDPPPPKWLRPTRGAPCRPCLTCSCAKNWRRGPSGFLTSSMNTSLGFEVGHGRGAGKIRPRWSRRVPRTSCMPV
jgi:hypothetical protein